ncbi:hypothetical protein Bca52824_095440 [Brassica carinata]|uniref:Auxin efflux carrier family protein n=1 Tax=Brassica carinata TaxID=52824 RepID=A0A8X7TIW2_BRACI|nr:hypothetical protein Bca52824_095440 [Brassica carinata]
MITRILSDLMDMPTAVAAGESVLGTIKIAVMPIAKVFTMCFLGLLMASKYLVFTLLLPCLIFSQLGQAVTLHKMLQWWFIPVNVVLGTISGSLIGFLVATIIRPPYPYFKFTIIQIGVGNIGNVPLVLLAALCRDKSNPFGDSEKCSIDGTAYISFGQWQVPCLLITILRTFHTLKLPPVQRAEPRGRVDSKITQIFVYLYDKLKLKQIIQPAIIASILAMILGAIPFTKKLIFTNGSPLFFFTDSCMILGDAMIPCILLALGGNLINGPGSSRLGFKTTAAIIVGRLVLVPPTGLGIVTLADKLGFLPADDKMFKFVLLLQHTMPTSVLSSAAVLFWVHIFAIFSMAGWILYINILF